MLLNYNLQTFAILLPLFPMFLFATSNYWSSGSYQLEYLAHDSASESVVELLMIFIDVLE